MNFFANAGIILIVALAGWVFLPFLPSFIWALVMAQVVRPIYLKLRLRCSAAAAAALMVVLVTVAVITPLSFVGGKLVYTAATSYQAFAHREKLTLSVQSITRLVDRIPLPSALRRIASQYQFDEESAISHASEYGQKAVDLLSGLATSAAMSAGGFIFAAVAFLILFFFACKDGEGWYDRLNRVVPPSFGLESLLQRIGTGASALFWGVAGTCFLQGVAGGLAFLVLGLPSPFLAGSLMMVCALVPAVGTALVWLPMAGWLAVSGEWGKAIGLALFGSLVIGMMDNVTRPLLSKIGGAQMSVMTVTIGAIGGIAAYGLTGIIVGPLALEAFSWLLEHLERRQSDGA